MCKQLDNAEHYPARRSMAQKFQHAHALRDVLGVTRLILVDALDGACHRRYSSFPNMTWIFSRTGTIVYKADWTDTDSVVRMVEYLLEVQQRRKSREKLNFSKSQIQHRLVNFGHDSSFPYACRS